MAKSKPKIPVDFPLYPHSSGQWAKKIKQATYYFGAWDDPQGALEKYLDEKDNIRAGRQRQSTATPVDTPGGIAVEDVLGDFYSDKERAFDTGDINERTLKEYKGICQIIEAALGEKTLVNQVGFDDLSRLRRRLGKGKNGKQVSPVTHKRLLTFARMIFCFANDELGTNVRYKKALKTPRASLIRKARNKIGERLFEATEIRQLLKASDPELRAMIHLGINCAFGPKDCWTLPVSAVDLDGGWVSYERPKTGAKRRCHLWPETIIALRAVIGERKSGTVFHKYDNRQVWNRHIVGRAFKELTEELDIYREGVTTFYSLRRTFETIASAGEISQAVIDLVMGHPPRDGDMGAVYRQRIYDEPLRKCAAHVRGWMLGTIVLS